MRLLLNTLDFYIFSKVQTQPQNSLSLLNTPHISELFYAFNKYKMAYLMK